MTLLKLNSRVIEVASLQLLLNRELKLNPKLALDGVFGRKTEAAVIRFQELHDLLPDGIVGPKTWLALGQKSMAGLPSQPISAGAPWMRIAYAELGVQEHSQPGQQNSRILEYHAATMLRSQTDEIPWCSSFVNWVLMQAGYMRTNNALASSWLQYGTPMATGQYGAICVLARKAGGGQPDVLGSSGLQTSRKAGGGQPGRTGGLSTGYHVGFYVSGSSSYVRLLGGNQSNRVKESIFYLSGYAIEGFRRPV